MRNTFWLHFPNYHLQKREAGVCTSQSRVPLVFPGPVNYNDFMFALLDWKCSLEIGPVFY